MALKVSDAAVKQVKELKQAQSLGDDVFLRMGVKGGGCSGMSYALEFDNELGPEDREFQIDGVRVVCDKKSYLYLNETMLDYVQQGLTGGFTFVNPNAKSSCGCGSSFSAQQGAEKKRGKKSLIRLRAFRGRVGAPPRPPAHTAGGPRE